MVEAAYRPVGSGHNNMAARCAGDVISPPVSPGHVVQATLTALISRLRGAGPVALRDVDALCIKGLEQDLALLTGCADSIQPVNKTQDKRQSFDNLASLGHLPHVRRAVLARE